jgi:hypothetical protein
MFNYLLDIFLKIKKQITNSEFIEYLHPFFSKIFKFCKDLIKCTKKNLLLFIIYKLFYKIKT